MTPSEWWLVFDVKRTDRERLDKRLSQKRCKELAEFAEEGRRDQELLKVARGESR